MRILEPRSVILKSLSVAFIFFFFLIFSRNVPVSKAAECRADGLYEGDLRAAMDAVLANNPSVANSPNLESDGRANGRIFLGLVASELGSMGFNATDQVLNGNGRPSTGDIIALWKSGDSVMERYDALAGESSPPKTIAESTTTTFTGAIPLSCVNGGGGGDCSDCNGGGGDGGDGGDGDGGDDSPDAPPPIDPSVYPPDLSSAGVDALSGKNPNLAFDPVKKLWLVVAENGSKILGQFMTDKNQKSGSVINIGGTDAHTPKIAYGPNAAKYLVVWTTGKDSSSALWGQLVSEDGSNSGSAFQIATGGAALYPASNIQYDPGTQRFVLAYEKAGNGTSIMLVTISGTGTVGGPISLANVTLKGSSPSVAVNANGQEYCSTYSDGDKIKIKPVSAGGTVGNATEVGQKAQKNVGITYDSASRQYTTAWLGINGTIQAKQLDACANDPNITSQFGLASGAQDGVLIQNTKGFGLFAINPVAANSSGTADHFVSYDSDGNQLIDQTIFTGKWKPDGFYGFWLSASPNTLTGMYAAAASPDSKVVKFVAGIGIPTNRLGGGNNIPASRDLPIPNKGLPTDFGQFIEALFTWSLSIIGLIIFSRFFYAGFLWFTASGNTANISKAKGIMKNAVYGALILFSAYLILNTINPDLIQGTFNAPGIPGTVPANPSATATSCLVNSGSSYTDIVLNTEDQVLASQPSLNVPSSTNSTSAFIKALITELKINGYNAGLVASCDGKGNLPLSIMVGFKDSEKTGEVCAIFDSINSSKTIEQTVQARCLQHGEWKLLQP